MSLAYKRNAACIDYEIVRLWVLKPTAVTSALKRKPDMLSANIRRFVVSPFLFFFNASELTLLVKRTVACY